MNITDVYRNYCYDVGATLTLGKNVQTLPTTSRRSTTMETTMKGEGRTQPGGCAPTNDCGEERGDKEARVARLRSESKDSFVTALEGLEERDHLVLDYTTPLEG